MANSRSCRMRPHCAMKTCCGASAISAALATGLQEWRLQRRTALALIPLGLYFVASMLRLATSDQMTAAAWLASPVPALLTILFVLALLAHAVVGMRSVLVDYVHTRARLVAAELLVRGAAVVLAGASVLAVLKLFLGR